MEPCIVKWLIIGTCLLIAFTGLWLSVLREIRNIKRGERDIQTLLYDKQNGTFNFSLAIGVLLIAGGLFAAIYTEKNNIGCSPSPLEEVENKEAKILFKLDYSDAPDNLRLLQKAPEFQARNIVKQESGYFEEDVLIPSDNSNYYALITKRVIKNRLGNDVIENPLEICFSRTNKRIENENILAILSAGEDKNFRRDPEDPGCIELCGEKIASQRKSFHLFQQAYAQTPESRNKTYGWAVPNLQTLKDERKTGFSQINIYSTFLNEDLQEADAYYYSVKINDTPIFFDGLLPKYIVTPFSYEKGIQIEFGIENLGFSGNENGYENIEIKLTFLRGSEVIRSVPLNLNYVALRKNDLEKIETSDGCRFEWEALFISRDENQIFIGSVPTADGAVFTKNRLARKNLTFNDSKMIGVIRPPYLDNPSYGVCVGLLLPNEQINFTFTYSEAEQIRAVLRANNYHPLIRTLSDN
ncbi:hypothetical protein [uncultured Draconibacterium sp.]|uniref:hypothetical protein n=1 Tax=uncultured Draconibacterium sp. TaxID=1573823 RepID=UPI002AA785B5|nr:hypothetical protein [uncultured Draconibacterium sp.]